MQGGARFRHVALWPGKGAWLLQSDGEFCSLDPAQCHAESIHICLLLVGLCISIIVVMCFFVFFREDKEEQIIPLCPQLIVKDQEYQFTIPLDANAENMVIKNMAGEPILQVAIDRPDPARPGASGVVATARLQNMRDVTLATVVSRNVAVMGQALALCRSGCDIFGFVEPDGPRYHVRHRTGVHLLMLQGDFDTFDIKGVNPVGSQVCLVKKVGSEWTGYVTQHVDAGLVICSLLAMFVHRHVCSSLPAPEPRPVPIAGLRGEDLRGEEVEDFEAREPEVEPSTTEAGAGASWTRGPPPSSSPPR